MKIPVMKLPEDATGIFKARLNRFAGIVDITQPEKAQKPAVLVHIHDPGRLKEILYPGNAVLLKHSTKKSRKTRWDIIAGRCNKHWVIVHSGYHRRIAEWILRNERISPFGRLKEIRPEVKFGHSRVDFVLDSENEGAQIWVEVKGCTLAENGIALFPDAPTERGKRHLRTLIVLKQNGLRAAVVMLVFRPEAGYFMPNHRTDPEFARLFFEALDNKVEFYAFGFAYERGNVYYTGTIPLCRK
ncbi:DNA/RNA nuclease SfsA [Candidatus Sumerlaeota bacterium]|nr:DNA/RNA nuclease SfsA [Candidatus Sumerlaeota bacterium]